MKRRSPLVRSVAATLALFAVTVPALAQGTEEQTEACSGDAFTLCRADIPDVAKITACMRVHRAELSPKCRKVFDASSAPAAAPKSAERPVKAERVANPERVAKTRPPKRGDHRVVAPKTVGPKTVAREPRALPPREAPPVVAVAPAPAPASSVPGLDSYRASIVASCQKGLIDPYTCKSTLEVLKGFE